MLSVQSNSSRTRHTEMTDFAYLFHDSAASWLEGRGDGRFVRYERFYRQAKIAAADKFDLEVSNEEYSGLCQNKLHWVLGVLDSNAFKHFAMAMALIYGGSLLVPAIARLAPVATGFVLIGGFVALRVMRRRQKKTS
jgi:hypothetical protein